MTRVGETPILSEAGILFFRDRRTHLSGSGAVDAAAAARAILGAQAQQEGPGLLALSLRTEGRPTKACLQGELFGEAPRRLVRTWGQRDTLHIYEPEDWPRVVAARGEWPQSGRRGALPSEPDTSATRRIFEEAGRPLFRRDLFGSIPLRFIDEVARHPGVAATGSSAERFAASRLIWRLALAGDICFAEKQGAEQSYVHRDLWFPDLSWVGVGDSVEAATDLARRYLGAHGPATAADLAHFFGSRISCARAWFDRLRPETTEVRCGAREGLVALKKDIRDLERGAPRGLSGWPVRLLPKWDTHLMRHADKGWLMPVAAERPSVWRKAGDISATVVARGRVVAIWSHKATKKRVAVSVTPLSGWRKSHLPGVRREAAALADYLEVPSWEAAISAG